MHIITETAILQSYKPMNS